MVNLLLADVNLISAPIPDDPAQRDALARQFPSGWFLRQSDHYLVIYDGHALWADTRVTLLESAHDTFLAAFRKIGINPQPLRQRLVCVLFNEHADFQTYAQNIDRFNNDWSGGYYSARTNRVAFFNFQTSPQVQNLLLDMRKAEADQQRWLGESANGPGSRSQLIDAQRRLIEARARYELVTAYGNIRQTIHESAHQLAFNTGVQRRDLQYPFWFSEGLATNFETIAPAAPFGPAFDNPSRRSEWIVAYRDHHLPPLSRLISLTEAPAGQIPRETAYAQAWSLFHYLYTQRPADLRRYINAMLAMPPGPRTADQLADDFIQSFGPPSAVETAWLHYLRENAGGGN
ncbi:MAG: DUF1570 domain-containing protein [Phycisphaerales bacterium]